MVYTCQSLRHVFLLKNCYYLVRNEAQYEKNNR